jgi:orotate phosphoribosyltransferase
LNYNNIRQRLMRLIKKEGIVVFENEIRLRSGQTTNYYYDIKKVAANPLGIHLLGDLLLDEVEKYNAKSVGGLESGAVLISTAIMMKSAGRYGDDISQFFVRKKPKPHGLQKRIEGKLIAPVVIVDDVITKGKSVMQAIDAVRNEGVSIAGVVCVIDREDKKLDALRKQFKFSPLFKHSDFKSFIDAKIKKKQQKIHPDS